VSGEAKVPRDRKNQEGPVEREKLFSRDRKRVIMRQGTEWYD